MVGSIFTGCTTIPTNNPRTFHLKKQPLCLLAVTFHSPSPQPWATTNPLSCLYELAYSGHCTYMESYNKWLLDTWLWGEFSGNRSSLSPLSLYSARLPGYFTDLSQGLRGRPCHKEWMARTGWLRVSGPEHWRVGPGFLWNSPSNRQLNGCQGNSPSKNYSSIFDASKVSFLWLFFRNSMSISSH